MIDLLVLLMCMATGGCGGDLSETVEDIVSMTSKMGVNSEEDWEENEEAASSFGEHSLVGRMIAKREIKESLFTTIFSRMWKGIGGWEVKVLAEEEDDSFVGITFKNQEEAKGILSKQPWIFNGGLLLLERWPSSGQWREAKLDKMAGDIQEIRWINESRMFLNGFVRMKIGFPLNQSIFVGRYIPCGGRKYWIQLKFERLPTLCFACGVWGHEKRECSKEVSMEMSVDGQQVPRYGQWLRDDDPTPHCFSAFSQSQAQEQAQTRPIVESRGERMTTMNSSDGCFEVVPPARETAGEKALREHLPVTVKSSGAVMYDKGSIVGEGTNSANMPGGNGVKVTCLSDVNQMGRVGVLNNTQPNSLGQSHTNNINHLRRAAITEHDGQLGDSIHEQGTEGNENEAKKRNNGGSASETEEERERQALLKGKQIACDQGISSASGVVNIHNGEGEKLGKEVGKKFRLRIGHVIMAKEEQWGLVRSRVWLQAHEGVWILTQWGSHLFSVLRLSMVQNFWDVDRVGMSGGLLLLWKEEISVRVDSSSPSHILARVAGKDFFPWTVTCFYGHPDAAQRKFSWELLRNLKEEIIGPWLCVGDFNEVVSLSEKEGGRIRRDVAMEDFRTVIDECRLIDFCSSKIDLTWCNGHELNPVMERLDRGLCNEEWLLNFDGADIMVLDWWESDHRPLVVDMLLDAERERCGKVKRKG
ncbi:hypothetical protein G4B88_008939 [Cannabis sativa]|uniref:CCHC-type domain-containing protein n=1 Tax=Cannabis sativa TaxID=3483 RepID=A0A7J6HPC0_CANSA|nr:hypothetical protein G4B88_008939 [Cannabis sativa]